MPVINPTPGRVVWYWPKAETSLAHDGKQPLAAHVCHVWGDRMVNLMVIDMQGNTHTRPSVVLVQEGDFVPLGNYCCWMPYQMGQARAQETLHKTTPARVLPAGVGTAGLDPSVVKTTTTTGDAP